MAAASAGDLTDMLKSSDSRTQKMPAQDMLNASMKAHMAASWSSQLPMASPCIATWPKCYHPTRCMHMAGRQHSSLLQSAACHCSTIRHSPQPRQALQLP